MFQSEHLQEKWAPLLNYEGLDPIKDSHRRAVTAVLLENQEKFLREEAAFGSGLSLMESPTNSANAAGASGGFGADSAAGGPTAGFDPVLISLIRRSMPNLVAYDLAGVQPMSGPTGLIFAMRSRYNSQSGSEAFFNEPDTAFSGQNEGFDLSGGFSDANAGIGTTNATADTGTYGGSNPAVLNPVGTASSTGYRVGQGMATGD
ncbi:MAG: ATP-binding protein, partial [bacterium]